MWAHSSIKRVRNGQSRHFRGRISQVGADWGQRDEAAKEKRGREEQPGGS